MLFLPKVMKLTPKIMMQQLVKQYNNDDLGDNDLAVCLVDADLIHQKMRN